MYYTIENEYLIAQIDDAGAQLHSLRAKKDGEEYLWQGDPAIWYGQAPVLFPIIGRLLDDTYRWQGKAYVLQKHGFARKRDFTLVSCAGNTAEFELCDDEQTLACYPFAFCLRVCFVLDGDTLRVTHTVHNRGDGDMYFSLGAHPGFNCAIGDYLEFDLPETLDTRTIDADSILIEARTPVLREEKRITLTEHLFDNDALILSGMRSKAVTLRSDRHDRAVRFTFGDVPYLGVWAKPAAPYV